MFHLYKQTIQDFSIYPGRELQDDECSKLQIAAGEMSAKMRAVRIISASNVSKKDLERRLVNKGENPEQAKKAVQWLEELSLVDDRATAEQIVRRCISKGYGVARARQSLYEKRVPKEYWDEALADYPDQSSAIVDYMQRNIQDPADNRSVKRAMDALIRKGHSYSEIRRAFKQLELQDEFLPED